MSTPISRDEWLKALGDAVRPCDPDALSAAEIAKMFQITRQMAYRRITQLLADGKAVSTFKMITTADGYPKRVVAYKLVTPPAKGKRR